MKSDTVYERVKAFVMAFLYTLMFFLLLGALAAFFIAPAASFIRYGDASLPDWGVLYRWVKIILACSLIVSVAIYCWAEWELWVDKKSAKGRF